MGSAAVAGTVQHLIPQGHVPSGPAVLGDTRAGSHITHQGPRDNGVPSSRTVPDYLATLAGLIEEDEVISEEEAIDRLYRKGGVSQESRTLVNGTTPAIAVLIGRGYWQWADPQMDSLRRRKPAHVVFVESRWKPTPQDATTRDLRNEVRKLREAVSGPSPRPTVTLQSGRALVLNPTNWPLAMRAGDFPKTWDIAPGEVVECDETTARAFTASGVLRRLTAEEFGEILASV